MRRLAVVAALGLISLTGLAVGLGLLLHFQPRAPVPASGAATSPSSVTRADVLALAESYVRHEWTATPANRFHGIDPDGIRVDTPDALSQETGMDPGWWVTTSPNLGIPYKWGGFDLPGEFDAGVRAGRYAGDSYTAEKRRLLDDAVSRHAAGIDCSGFVSRCWKLPRSFSTRELPSLCDPVTDPSQVRPGDIFNRHNVHVRLFAGWADPGRTRLHVYEAATKVRRQEYELAAMIAQGYSAWRYRGLVDERTR